MLRASALTLAFLGATTVGAAASDLRIVPLEPKPGEHVTSTTPNIAFELRSNDDVHVSRDAVHVTLDGTDESDRVRVVGTELVLVPDTALQSGHHDVSVRVDDADGGELSYAWRFTVSSDGDAAASIDSQSESATNLTNGANALVPGPNGDGTVAPGWAGAPGTLAPAWTGPAYWGDSVPFVYSGWPGFGGFLTVPGLVGTYPLTPLFGNYYGAFVPIPFGFYGTSPVVVCHVSNPPPPGYWNGHRPWHFPRLLSLENRLHVVAERRPANAVDAAPPTRAALVLALRTTGPPRDGTSRNAPVVVRHTSVEVLDGMAATHAAPTAAVRIEAQRAQAARLEAAYGGHAEPRSFEPAYARPDFGERGWLPPPELAPEMRAVPMTAPRTAPVAAPRSAPVSAPAQRSVH